MIPTQVVWLWIWRIHDFHSDTCPSNVMHNSWALLSRRPTIRAERASRQVTPEDNLRYMLFHPWYTYAMFRQSGIPLTYPHAYILLCTIWCMPGIQSMCEHTYSVISWINKMHLTPKVISLCRGHLHCLANFATLEKSRHFGASCLATTH